MPKEKGTIILWTQYFDKGLTRLEGRRVPRSLARNNPKAADIQRTARELGYDALIDPDKAYPRFWWKKVGKIIIRDAGKKKTDVIREIAETMKESKGQQAN